MNSVERPKRVILLGFDGMMPSLLEKFRTHLPNIDRIMRDGSFASALPCSPVDTPTNWTTIATGAWSGDHGRVGFGVHLLGEPLYHLHSSWPRSMLNAEYIWEAASRAGKRTIIINYPGSWPETSENIIIVGGAGFGGIWRIAWACCYTTSRKIRLGRQVKIKRASGWRCMVDSHQPPLETVIEIDFGPQWKQTMEGIVLSSKRLRVFMQTQTLNVLIVDSKGDGYDKIYLCRGRDLSHSVAELREGEWSDYIYAYFWRGGRRVKGGFRVKLLKLSGDGRDLQIYRTDIYKCSGWTYPPYLADKIVDEIGQYIPTLEMSAGWGLGWFGDETYLEHVRLQGEWIAKTARYLCKNNPWDLLFIQMHIHDTVNHRYLTRLWWSEELGDRDQSRRLWQFFLSIYRLTDEIIAEILEGCADEETAIIIISDHGGLPIRTLSPFISVLMKHGLVSYVKDERTGTYKIDWRKTKVSPISYANWIWVNLKGRDPDGVVPPEEYENVRTQIIAALSNLRDPTTGECPFSLIMRREEARYFGLWGDRVGDVVFYFREGFLPILYKSARGTYFEEIPADALNEDFRILSSEEAYPTLCHGIWLPDSSLGSFSHAATLLMYGPGIRRGYKIEKNVWLVDVAPTIAYLLGFDPPKQCGGRVIIEALTF